MVHAVPVVAFQHEHFVSASFESSGEWESLQTELLQLFLRPGDVVRFRIYRSEAILNLNKSPSLPVPVY